MQRFNPGVLKLKKLINKNFLGNIHTVSVDIKSLMPMWHKYEKLQKTICITKKNGWWCNFNRVT